jgi:hypothetical protein
MDQDEWFDEDADEFEIPSAEKKAKKSRRPRPVADDWDEGDDWGDWDDDFPLKR